MSKLLIEDENYLILFPILVKAFRCVNAALFLQGLHYRISSDKAPEREGKKWYYSTYHQWLKEFFWISKTTLRGVIKQLEDLNVIISKEFSTSDGDRTKWYTVNYDQLLKMKIITNKTESKTDTPCVEIRHPMYQNPTLVYKEEEINKYNKQNNNNKGNTNTLETTNETVVVLCDIGFNKHDAEQILAKHGEQKVLEKIKMMKDLTELPYNQIGWLKSACSKDFCQITHDRKSRDEKIAQQRNLEELEMRKRFQEMDHIAKTKHTADGVRAYQVAMRLVGRKPKDIPIIGGA